MSAREGNPARLCSRSGISSSSCHAPRELRLQNSIRPTRATAECDLHPNGGSGLVPFVILTRTCFHYLLLRVLLSTHFIAHLPDFIYYFFSHQINLLFLNGNSSLGLSNRGQERMALRCGNDDCVLLPRRRRCVNGHHSLTPAGCTGTLASCSASPQFRPACGTAAPPLPVCKEHTEAEGLRGGALAKRPALPGALGFLRPAVQATGPLQLQSAGGTVRLQLGCRPARCMG